MCGNPEKVGIISPGGRLKADPIAETVREDIKQDRNHQI